MEHWFILQTLIEHWSILQRFMIYTSNETFVKHVNLLLLLNSENVHYVFIKGFKRFMSNKTIHQGKKQYCWYCFQLFSCQKVLECHVKDCLAINHRKSVLLPEESEYVNFQNLKP